MNSCNSRILSTEHINVCEIVGCVNCEQVQFEIAPMLQTGAPETLEKIKQLYAIVHTILFNRFPLKKTALLNS